MGRNGNGTGSHQRDLRAQMSLARRLQVLNDLMRVAVSSLHVAEVIDGIGEQVANLSQLVKHDFVHFFESGGQPTWLLNEGRDIRA